MDLLSIGAFAAATGLTIPALRHYDEIGVLKPVRVDPGSGYRRYAADQVTDARLICGLRAVGVPLDEVRAVVGRPATQVRSALAAHRARLTAQVREVTERILAVDEFIEKGNAVPALQTIRPVQIRIGVADLAASVAFYTAAFDVVFNEAISSLQFGIIHSERFFLVTLEEREPAGGSRFGLLVAGLDEAHARALAAGAGEEHPPVELSWKPRTSAVRDPDGNVVDLYQLG